MQAQLTIRHLSAGSCESMSKHVTGLQLERHPQSLSKRGNDRAAQVNLAIQSFQKVDGRNLRVKTKVGSRTAADAFQREFVVQVLNRVAQFLDGFACLGERSLRRSSAFPAGHTLVAAPPPISRKLAKGAPPPLVTMVAIHLLLDFLSSYPP